jgi:peptidyl-tRNA hydrolase
MTWTIRHYVIVREDLPPGVVAAQVAHAAGISAHHSDCNPSEASVVVLGARNTQHIHALARRFTNWGLSHVQIHEPDAPWNGALMAIGLPPTNQPNFSHYFQDLELLYAKDRTMRRKRSTKI